MNLMKIVYYASTVLMSLLFLFSAGMYLFNYDEIKGVFSLLGFPTWIVYPLAIAKIAGVVAVWVRKPKFLMEWAYAGFLFDVLLAAGAHIAVGDGEQFGAILAFVLIVLSRFSYDKVFTSEKS